MNDVKALIERGKDSLMMAEVHINNPEMFARYIDLAETYNALAERLLKTKTFNSYE